MKQEIYAHTNDKDQDRVTFHIQRFEESVIRSLTIRNKSKKKVFVELDAYTYRLGKNQRVSNRESFFKKSRISI